MSRLISLTLLTKPGCHLCEEAIKAVDSVVSEFRDQNSDDVQLDLTEVNILENDELNQKYAEEIPVLQINGETHAYWRIDSERLIKALNDLA